MTTMQPGWHGHTGKLVADDFKKEREQKRQMEMSRGRQRTAYHQNVLLLGYPYEKRMEYIDRLMQEKRIRVAGPAMFTGTRLHYNSESLMQIEVIGTDVIFHDLVKDYPSEKLVANVALALVGVEQS